MFPFPAWCDTTPFTWPEYKVMSNCTSLMHNRDNYHPHLKACISKVFFKFAYYRDVQFCAVLIEILMKLIYFLIVKISKYNSIFKNK